MRRLAGIRAMFGLVRRDLSAAPARSWVSALGIAIGAWSLTLVIALGLGAQELVLKEVVRELPLDVLEVIPKTLDLGLFRVDAGNLLGSATLSPRTVEQLRRLPEVAAVYPKLEVNLPLGAQGGARLFGRRLYTDLFMTGIPTELVQAEVPQGFVDDPAVVPVVISDQLLELYNASVAPAVGAPKLTADSLTGFEFDIVVGHSLMLGSRGARTTGVERGRIAGTSRYAMRLGVSVPLATAERLLAKYAEPGAPARYTGLLVRVNNAADVPRVVQSVEALGFTVDETANRTRHILTAATALCAAVGGLVLLLAALNIAHSFFAMLSERRRELAILRAVGASRTHVMSLVLTQAAALGVTGGLLGVISARLAAGGIDAAARRWLPDFPFKPASFFVFPAWLWLFALSAAVVAAVLGASLPAWRATRGAVTRGLAE